jgi:uncharacterized protein (TIGR02996 family)
VNRKDKDGLAISGDPGFEVSPMTVPMNPENGFLQAIIHAPDDDTPRLVFADWLADHGEPERGEFIRVQIQLAGLAEDDPRRAELKVREEALLGEHADAWAKQLNLEAGLVKFRRGLAEEIITNTRRLLASGHEWFRMAPVRHLTVWSGQGNCLGLEEIKRLASWPQLARLLSLCLPENGIGDVGAAILSASPFVAGLEVLDLGSDRIADAGASALALSPHLARLKELRLDHNDIGASGAYALARSPYLSGLVRLDLDHNFFFMMEDEEEAVEALKVRFGDRVEL